MEHVAGQEPRHGRRLQVQLPLLGVRASYSENGTGETLALTPALSPQEKGKHAHFPEFSRRLVWNCFMGTYVGSYGNTEMEVGLPSAMG